MRPAIGTLRAVKDTIRKHDYGGGVEFRRLHDTLPFDRVVLFTALKELEKKGVIYRCGEAEFTHHDDGSCYKLTEGA